MTSFMLAHPILFTFQLVVVCLTILGIVDSAYKYQVSKQNIKHYYEQKDGKE